MKKLLLLLMIVPMIGLGQETGCISGDCENGYGTYIWENGDKYEGEWADNFMHGKGVIIYKVELNVDAGMTTYSTGAKYVGEWSDGKPDSVQGIFTYSNGDIRKSLYESSQTTPSKCWDKNGNQIDVILMDFGQQTGCISGDCVDGYGTYIWANGDKYEGEWGNGKKSGYGFFTFGYNKEKIYLSELNATAPAFAYNSGFGDFSEYFDIEALNCSKYEGEFRWDEMWGFGILTFEGGIIWTGLFSEGRLHMGCISGDCENGSGVWIGLWCDMYVGEFNEGKRHGKGTYTWGPISKESYTTVGSQYVGDWENNRRHGVGIETSNDGSKYEGEYRNHQKNGKGIYVSAESSYEGIGAVLSGNIDSNYVVITKVYKGFPSEKAGLIEGDKILEANGETAKGKTTQELSSILKGPANTEVNILIERNGNNITFRFNREKVKLPGYKYTGEFKDDKRHGQGIYISSFGEKYQGLFEEGKFISGECWDEDGNEIECP